MTGDETTIKSQPIPGTYTLTGYSRPTKSRATCCRHLLPCCCGTLSNNEEPDQ